MKRTAAEVSEIIERFLDGTSQPYEWDDFTSIPIADPFLDGIRHVCAHVDSAFPPEPESHRYCSERGAELIRAIASHLKWAN